MTAGVRGGEGGGLHSGVWGLKLEGRGIENVYGYVCL